MQATRLGSYLFYGRDRDFMAANTPRRGRARERREPGRRLARGHGPGDAFTITLPAQNKALGVTAGRLVLTDPPSAGAFTFEPAQGCAVYPEVETSATGKPFTSRTPWGEVKGMIDLHLHAMAFEFLGGKAHCGKPWSPYGAPYALVDCPDHQVGQRLRRRPRERPLRQPGALPRPGRLADLQGLAEPRLAHPRADLLQVDRARVHGRAARDGEPVRREQAAVRALSVQAERLRRDGLGAPPEQGHRGAPGLHRRPERRSRPRLVPHRDRPVPGAARDRAGQARGDQGHRGVGAVRLPRLQRRAAVRPRQDRPRDRRRPRAWACARWS